MSAKPMRSWLFVPGMDERKIEKAATSEADALILDLEDAVAISQKPKAREITRDAIARHGSAKAIYVRVNDLTTGMTSDDLRAVCIKGLTGIVLPMVEDPEMARIASRMIDRLEAENGLEAGAIDLFGIIETAAGVLNAGAIGRAGGRLRYLMPGAGDLTQDLGIPTSNVGAHIANAKLQVALASRAGNLQAPIDTAFFDVTDDAGYRADCEQARDLGFQGKAAIHPRQIAIANEVFSPSAADIAEAQKIVDAFRDAEKRGLGAITVDNKLVDYAMVKTADKLLARARALDLTTA